jgi:hypothetical protein
MNTSTVQCISAIVTFGLRHVRLSKYLEDSCIVFENFTASIWDLMVPNWVYWWRVSEANKRIFATIKSRGRRGRDRMVVGFTTTYMCNQCLSPLKLWVRRCTRYNVMWFSWNIVDSGVKHHKPIEWQIENKQKRNQLLSENHHPLHLIYWHAQGK